ncbi:hypothetical protein [Methanosarcina acetivorans]|nr:hypothetical protein [Methanosarcina acetivorans]
MEITAFDIINAYVCEDQRKLYNEIDDDKPCAARKCFETCPLWEGPCEVEFGEIEYEDFPEGE